MVDCTWRKFNGNYGTEWGVEGNTYVRGSSPSPSSSSTFLSSLTFATGASDAVRFSCGFSSSDVSIFSDNGRNKQNFVSLVCSVMRTNF